MTPLLIPLVTGATVAFWMLAPVMILGALGMIAARKPVHSALCLAAVMISLAVQYAALEAPFLFAENGGNVQGIAALIFDRYVFAFEATSALLITAAVGAMVLAHRERLSKRRTQSDLAGLRLKRYAETGQHPGPLPTPGVFARHNAVDTPALLPDGSVSELSVSATLKARGAVLDSQSLVQPVDDDRRLLWGFVGEGRTHTGNARVTDLVQREGDLARLSGRLQVV